MKERPIIFAAASVRATLAGTKTQTRRVVRDQGSVTDIAGGGVEPVVWWVRGIEVSPYGEVGDRLWVREAWAHPFRGNAIDACVYRAEADEYTGGGAQRVHGWSAKDSRLWRSPILMPRWASRLTLEITAVRVERLQEISEADAVAELGCVGTGPNNHRHIKTFAQGWDSINGKRAPWESNPWVWVLTFERLAATPAEVRG